MDTAQASPSLGSASSSFTPGSWEVSENGVHVRPSNGGEPICKFYTHYGLFANNEANARLIAAAPDMYKALNAAWCRSYGWEEMVFAALSRANESERS